MNSSLYAQPWQRLGSHAIGTPMQRGSASPCLNLRNGNGASRRGRGIFVSRRRFVLGDRGSASNGTKSPRIGRGLAGSAIGLAAGTSVGLLLWRGAAEAGIDDGRHDRRWRQDADPATVLFAAGLFAIVAGGPIGAVEGAGIETRRMDAYIVAGIGEVTLGGLGYGIASRLTPNATGRVLGMGVGAAIGAAAGALLIGGRGERGAVAYRGGAWRLVPPDLRVRPNIRTGRSPSIDVMLLSVQL